MGSRGGMVRDEPVGRDARYPDYCKGDYFGICAAWSVLYFREDRRVLRRPLLCAWSYIRSTSHDPCTGSRDDQRDEETWVGRAGEGTGAVRREEAAGTKGETSLRRRCARQGAFLGGGYRQESNNQRAVQHVS